MTNQRNFVDHLSRESARFAEDLLWHLGEVQWFWGEVVRHRPTRR